MPNRKPPISFFDPSYLIVTRVANQLIANNTFTKIQFDTVNIANDITWDGTNFWAVISTEGMYHINGFFQNVASAAAHVKLARIFVNGVLTFSKVQNNVNVTGGNNVSVDALAYLFAGDTVYLEGFQNSGVGLNTAVVGMMSQLAIMRNTP